MSGEKCSCHGGARPGGAWLGLAGLGGARQRKTRKNDSPIGRGPQQGAANPGWTWPRET